MIDQQKNQIQYKSRITIFLRCLMGGGVERMMVNLTDSLATREISVDLVLTRKEGSFLRQVSPKVRIVDLQAPWLPSSLPKLVCYLKREKPIALLSAGHYCNEIALWSKYLAGVSTQIVVSERNPLSVEAENAPQITARLTPWAARLFYPWSDGIVAVSHGVAEDLSRVTGIGLERIQTIYNPVITPDIFVKAQAPVEHPWLEPGEPPIILGAGRFQPQKDFPTLIRAFAKVRQVSSARLMLLGAGPEKHNIITLIEELNLKSDVALLGFVNNPYAYMANVDVFVLSSAWEGFGNVLVEAMAVGTPVVSTNCKGGPAEILAQGKYGFLVPVADSEAMAQAILKCLSGQQKKVNPTWLAQFSLEYATQKYLNVLGILTP